MYYQAMAIKRQWLTGSVGACPLIKQGERMMKKIMVALLVLLAVACKEEVKEVEVQVEETINEGE